MDDLKNQFSDSNKEVQIKALSILRKEALKGCNLMPYIENLLQLIQADEVETRLLVLKVAENYLKLTPYRTDTNQEQKKATIKALVSLYLKALSDKIAKIRKEAIYGIYTIYRVEDYLGINERSGNASVLNTKVLALIAPLIADTGSDLNEIGEPIERKGTLTITEMVKRILSYFPQKMDYTPVFHAVVPALERMHFYISNDILDKKHGQKMVEKIIDVFELLVGIKRVPLPASSFPDTYPNYIVELISFLNDPKYYSISDSSLYCIRRQLIESKTYLNALVETLQIDSYEAVKDVVLYLLAQAIEKGYSLNYLLPQIEHAISMGKIDSSALPEALKKILG